MATTSIVISTKAFGNSNSSIHRLVLTALIIIIAAGCVARMLIDKTFVGDSTLASVVLISCFFFLALFLGLRISLFALLLLPAFFGASPWNSPVRATLGSVDFPLYLFDLIIFAATGVAIIKGIGRQNSKSTNFIRQNWVILTIICIMLVYKIVDGDFAGATIRNAALFYYFPSICLIMAMINKHLDIKNIVPWLILRLLPLTAFAPLVVLIGIAIGARDLVLVNIQQGMVEPIAPLVWLPPGSLITLTFCGAAFLFDRHTALRWKLVIVVLLAYDFVTYFNRAMWVGIIAGICVNWVVFRGWKRGALPVLITLIVVSMSLGALRDVMKEGHHDSSEWRLLAWKLTLDRIIERPLVGHSYNESLLTQVLDNPESLQAIDTVGLLIDPQARSPHNSYLSLLFFGGLLQGGSVILFILFTLTKLAKGIVRKKHEVVHKPMSEAVFRGAVAVVVYAGFNVVLETPIEGITFWIVIFSAWAWALDLDRSPRLGPVAYTKRIHI